MAEEPPAIYRAPMRARDRDLPLGDGAAFGIEQGLVGIGDELPREPRDLDDAIELAADTHGEKAARMLERFAQLPEGTLIWTQEDAGRYRLGRIRGVWRYATEPAAIETGIRHVRAAEWLPSPIGDAETPTGVRATFARGGRNLQRIHDDAAAQQSAALWASRAPG